METAIARVTQMLLADERISGAILFGSAAKGLARSASDLDVAVVPRTADDATGLGADYLDLIARLSLAAGRDVHLILLDRVEPVLGRQVFLHGRTLFDRDPRRTAAILERITLDYFDGEFHRRMRSEALEQRREARRG
jgi:predicted nucleotidyltransferase